MGRVLAGTIREVEVLRGDDSDFGFEGTWEGEIVLLSD